MSCCACIREGEIVTYVSNSFSLLNLLKACSCLFQIFFSFFFFFLDLVTVPYSHHNSLEYYSIRKSDPLSLCFLESDHEPEIFFFFQMSFSSKREIVFPKAEELWEINIHHSGMNVILHKQIWQISVVSKLPTFLPICLYGTVPLLKGHCQFYFEKNTVDIRWDKSSLQKQNLHCKDWYIWFWFWFWFSLASFLLLHFFC